MVRDYKDASTVIELLLVRNQFTSENLINILIGENGASSVNVENDKESINNKCNEWKKG